MDCKNRIIKLRESTGLNRKDFFSLGLKENILWAIFECQKDCSPIFKIDIVKNGLVYDNF